jgi:hypothetical protein
MNESSRTNFHTRSNDTGDDSQAIPAWVYVLGIMIITVIAILR